MKNADPKIEAGTENMERRKKYKVTRFRLGLCVNCGDERGGSLFKRLCTACGESKKKKRRKKLGSKPWKEGNPGRPPYAALPQDSGDGSQAPLNTCGVFRNKRHDANRELRVGEKRPARLSFPPPESGLR